MDTSKATGRPWRAAINAVGGVILSGPDGPAAILKFRDSNLVTAGDPAALIVARVNGWEALVAERDALKANLESVASHRRALLAERDALREALAGLLRWTDCFPEVTVDEDADRDIPVVAAARAALGKGAGA